MIMIMIMIMLMIIMIIKIIKCGAKLHAIPRFPTGSFAVHFGDHLLFEIIYGQIWGSFLVAES